MNAADMPTDRTSRTRLRAIRIARATTRRAGDAVRLESAAAAREDRQP